MPIRKRGSGGGGGGVLDLGPQTNTFGTGTTANRAAAETLRNTYASANAAWLTQYNENRSFWIRLQWDDGTVEQRRNVAGDDWEDVTNVIRGPIGPRGPRGATGKDYKAMEANAYIDGSEIKELDQTYIEIAPAPGAGKYIAVDSIYSRWGRTADVAPPIYTDYQYLAISEDTTLTEAEATNTSTGRRTEPGQTFPVASLPTWDSGSRYIFVGVPESSLDVWAVIDNNDPYDSQESDPSSPRAEFLSDWERVPGTTDIDGIPVKWWRTSAAVASYPSSRFSGVWVSLDVGGDISRTITGLRLLVSLLFAKGSQAKPLYWQQDDFFGSGYTDEALPVLTRLLEDVLKEPNDTTLAETVGNHTLLENSPLVLGILADAERPPSGETNVYSSTAYDDYTKALTAANSGMGLVVRYAIHDIASIPTS